MGRFNASRDSGNGDITKPRNPRGTPYEEAAFLTFEFPAEGEACYEYITGQALSRFLTGLREGKILSTVCKKCVAEIGESTNEVMKYVLVQNSEKR